MPARLLRRRQWLLAGALLLLGCSTHGIRVNDLPGPTVRSSWSLAGIRDERQSFSELFCRKLGDSESDGGGCEDWLWMPETAPVSRHPALAGVSPAQRTLVIVPGIFGECVAPWVTPYSQDHEALRAMGYRVKVLPLKGRASSVANARVIHEHLTDPELQLTDAIVIAYSKGASDFMLAFSQPESAAWRGKVSAFVSVAGTVYGSPAANHAAGLYRSLLARIPVEHCPPSDGGGIQSLTYIDARRVSEAFIASDPPFATYSVVAIAAGVPVNPLLVGFHRWLSRIDERNDGQVLMEDAVIPGSTVLGVFRADHWSIALPFEESSSLLMRSFGYNNRFPRGALVRAILEFAAPVAVHPPTMQEF